MMQKGFTLVELLVVVAIIGILSAIAIPAFNKYRVKSYNSIAKSNIRNLIDVEEAYYAGYQTYHSYACEDGNVTDGNDMNFVCSANVFVHATVTSTGEVWTGTAYHIKGNITYKYNSSEGKIDTE